MCGIFFTVQNITFMWQKMNSSPNPPNYCQLQKVPDKSVLCSFFVYCQMVLKLQKHGIVKSNSLSLKVSFAGIKFSCLE